MALGACTEIWLLPGSQAEVDELISSPPSQPEPESLTYICPPCLPTATSIGTPLPAGQCGSFLFQRPCHLEHTPVLVSVYTYFQIYIISAGGKKHHKMANRIFPCENHREVQVLNIFTQKQRCCFLRCVFSKIFPLFQLNHLVSEVGKEERGH